MAACQGNSYVPLHRRSPTTRDKSCKSTGSHGQGPTCPFITRMGDKHGKVKLGAYTMLGLHRSNIPNRPQLGILTRQQEGRASGSSMKDQGSSGHHSTLFPAATKLHGCNYNCSAACPHVHETYTVVLVSTPEAGCKTSLYW